MEIFDYILLSGSNWEEIFDSRTNLNPNPNLNPLYDPNLAAGNANIAVHGNHGSINARHHLPPNTNMHSSEGSNPVWMSSGYYK